MKFVKSKGIEKNHSMNDYKVPCGWKEWWYDIPGTDGKEGQGQEENKNVTDKAILQVTEL